MPVAITREVSPSITRCELTHVERQPIDFPLAQQQHRIYCDTLASLGCDVRMIDADPDLPDCVFVEDIAIVLDELAILTRPGAESRRREGMGMAKALEPLRTLQVIEEPATLDGGDVLQVGKRIYAGRSTRTNDQGLSQLANLVRPFGYEVIGVDVRGALHLKSAITSVAPETFVINRAWTDSNRFDGSTLIDVDPSEPQAANALRLGGKVVFPISYPRTAARLRQHGIEVVTVDVSELAKAEGGVTCCALLVG